MLKKVVKDNWTYLIVVAVFISLSCIYFSPALNGYSLFQSDTSSWRGMAKELIDYREIYGEEALWTNSIFSGMPGYQISTLHKNGGTFVRKLISLGLPTPIPFFFIAFLSFFILAKSIKVETWLSAVGSVAYGLMTYNMLIVEAGHNTKMLAIAFMPAVLGAFLNVYRSRKLLLWTSLLALFLVLELAANHVQMTYYFTFVLLAVGISELVVYIKKEEVPVFLKRTSFILIAGIIAVLANFSNYYFTYSFAKETMRGGTKGLTVQPEGRGIELEKNKTSGLNRDYIVQWCYGKQESLNLLVPSAKGESRKLTGEFFEQLSKDSPRIYNYAVQQYQQNGGKVYSGYWGDQPFTSGPNYLGAVVVLLALLYIIFVKTPLKWALTAVSLLALLLSWGKNLGGSVEGMWLTNFFIDYVPLYNKFRAVSSILVILNFTFPFMAMLFVWHIMQNIEWAKTNMKKLIIASGVIVGLILVSTVVFSDALDYKSQREELVFESLYQQYQQSPQGVNPLDAEEELVNFRKGVVQGDAWRTIGLMTIAMVLLYLMVQGVLKRQVAILVLGAIVLGDIWMIDKRYLNNEKEKRKYKLWEKNKGNPNTSLASKGDIQILNLEAQTNPKIIEDANNRIAGYKKQKIRLTQKDKEAIQFAALNFNTNYRVLDLGNPFNSSAVSYFHKSSGGYNAAKLRRYQDIIDFYLFTEIDLIRQKRPQDMKVFNMLNTKYYMYQGEIAMLNPHAMGNAWFVDDIKLVDTPDEDILGLKEVDLSKTALVYKDFEGNIKRKNYERDSNSTIRMTNYLPNHITYEANATSDRFAVFSEIYYKNGWNAYMDGEIVPYVRTNYLLRGMEIPAGKHSIEFKFEPAMFKAGNMINLLAFGIILIGLGYALILEFNSRKNVINEQ